MAVRAQCSSEGFLGFFLAVKALAPCWEALKSLPLYIHCRSLSSASQTCLHNSLWGKCPGQCTIHLPFLPGLVIKGYLWSSQAPWNERMSLAPVLFFSGTPELSKEVIAGRGSHSQVQWLRPQPSVRLTGCPFPSVPRPHGVGIFCSLLLPQDVLISSPQLSLFSRRLGNYHGAAGPGPSSWERASPSRVFWSHSEAWAFTWHLDHSFSGHHCLEIWCLETSVHIQLPHGGSAVHWSGVQALGSPTLSLNPGSSTYQLYDLDLCLPVNEVQTLLLQYIVKIKEDNLFEVLGLW